MADLIAISDAMRAATFESGDTGEVAMARRFLQDLDTAQRLDGKTPVSAVATRGALYLYNGFTGVWDELGQDALRGLVACYDGRPVLSTDVNGNTRTKPLSLTSRKIDGTIRCILSDLDHYDPEFFDLSRNGVAVRNGFVTVTKDGLSFEPPSPSNRCLAALAFDYDADAQCPIWRNTLGRIFGLDPDGQAKGDLLQEFVGGAVAGISTDYASCLVLIGNGANGKSVVAETIAENLFSPRVVTYSAPQSWSGRFSTARLVNSRINIASELPDADIQASDVFKSVVDGGCIEVEKKGKDPFSIRPRAGHLFLTNAPPTTRDNSEGFWRRFLMLKFDHDFSKDADRETKETVKARLASEAPGLLLWALEGAARLLRIGGYTKPDSHTETLDEVRKATDSVAAFVDECCKVDETAETKSSAVHEAFCRWAEKVRRHQLSNKALTLRLKAMGVGHHVARDGSYLSLEVLPQVEWCEGKLPRLEVVK